jgi:hypothetical protein
MLTWAATMRQPSANRPGLHLPPDLAGYRGAIVQGRSDRKIGTVGRNDRARQRAREAGGRPRSTESLDFPVAVENFRPAIADGPWIVTKDRAKGRDVVRHQRFLVTFEFGFDFGDDLRQVDLHPASLRRALGLRSPCSDILTTLCGNP